MNNKWRYVPFTDVFDWCSKSNIGSREAAENGKYKLFVASATEIKRYNEFLENGERIVFGTGGNPCIHYVNEAFSYTNHTECARSKFEDVFVKFYYYYFQKDRYKDLQSTFVGGGIKNSSKKKIGSLLVPQIDYDEQKRIVAKIEELFSELDNGVETLKKTKQQLAVYRQAVLKESFGEIKEYIPLGKITVSRLGKMLDKEKNTGILQPYLRNINVRWFSFDLSDLLEMRIEPEENEKYSVTKGDLIICEGGEPGRCAIWEQDETIFYQKALHRVRFTDDSNPKFYMYYFWFAAQTGKLNPFFTGMGIKHLTGQSLVKVPVPTARREEQDLIVQEIESRLSVCDSIEKAVDIALQQAEAMRQSILKKAFEGEL